MASAHNENLGDNWVTNPNRDPKDIETEFDESAADYEEMSAIWDYRGARDGAAFLMRHVGPEARIVEAGCGSGLIGEILSGNGYAHLTGVDISTNMLTLAQAKGAYTDGLHKADITAMPFADGGFDALLSVAVLTYAADLEVTFSEFERVVRPGGRILFSHRLDLEPQCGFAEARATRLDDGRWIEVEVTEPQLYYPNKADYGNEVLIRYHCYERV